MDKHNIEKVRAHAALPLDTTTDFDLGDRASYQAHGTKDQT